MDTYVLELFDSMNLYQYYPVGCPVAVGHPVTGCTPCGCGPPCQWLYPVGVGHPVVVGYKSTQLHSSMSRSSWSTECHETDHDHAAESTTPLQVGSSDCIPICVAVTGI